MNKKELKEGYLKVNIQDAQHAEEDYVVVSVMSYNGLKVFSVHEDLIDQLDEPEKVVVPQFVGDWIDEYKDQGYSLSNAIFNISRGDEDLDIEEYFRENPRTCIDAWDNGYTVEEKKYQVKDKNVFMLFKLDGKVVPTAEHFIVSTTSNIENDLTEQEIKDYDPRYMPFAEEVQS